MSQSLSSVRRAEKHIPAAKGNKAASTKARERKASPVPKRWSLKELADEMKRLAMKTEIHFYDSGKGLWFAIEAEHRGETHEIMFVSQDGDPAKQMIAECKRVAEHYLQLAAHVGACLMRDEIDAEVAAERGAA